MVDQERINRFIKLLKFDEPNKSQVSEEEIDELKDETMIPHLYELINGTEEKQTKLAALRGLGYIKDTTSIKSLIDFVMEEDEKDLKIEAIKILAKFGDDVAIAPLNRIVNRSNDREIIQTASMAVQVIQGIASIDSFD